MKLPDSGESDDWRTQLGEVVDAVSVQTSDLQVAAEVGAGP